MPFFVPTTDALFMTSRGFAVVLGKAVVGVVTAALILLNLTIAVIETSKVKNQIRRLIVPYGFSSNYPRTGQSFSRIFWKY